MTGKEAEMFDESRTHAKVHEQDGKHATRRPEERRE